MMFSIKQSLKNEIAWRLFLSGGTGLLLGLAFPPSPVYSLAYIAFIPLFWLIEEETKTIRILFHIYFSIFVFHIITVYWTGGFIIGKDLWMMIAGLLLIVVHPLFYIPFLWLSLVVRNHLGRIAGIISFALLWISFEYVHSLGEYSFPWLTIGNSQAYDLNRIQIAEFTSVYGISFIIFVFNILAFELLRNLVFRFWTWKSTKTVIFFILLILTYLGPSLYGFLKLNNSSASSENGLSLGIIQPNFDPWEKWGGNGNDKYRSYFEQLNYYLLQTKQLIKFSPKIVVWPETAIPFHIFHGRYSLILKYVQDQIDSSNVYVFTGLPSFEYFDSVNAPATAERIGNSNTYVESYNSAILFGPQNYVSKTYRKIVLVPFAERIPYAETFRFLIEPLKWNVGISSWGKGKDTVIYSVPYKDSTQVKFAGMICYESVYPNFVREFVRRGAQFLIIITNDSWWGATSGAYQHAAFASLRAVETRRWIVQDANGGISLLIDPYGRVHTKTRLYTSASVLMNLQPEKTETFYVRYGDVFATICLYCSGVFVLLAFIKKYQIQKVQL